MPDDVQDEPGVALVTGGGSGIGEVVVARLAADGHPVAVLDLDLDRSQRVATAVSDAGGRALALQADVRDEDSVSEALRRIGDELGPIDVLVNSAGIGDDPEASVDTDLDRWQRVIDVNLRGTFVCARLAARGMIERRRGAVVNIASIVGLVGLDRRSAYGPSKAGVINLTRTLASEWAPFGVRVNAVAPGFVRTPLLEQSAARGLTDLDVIEARIPAGRLGSTDDIARAIAFLVGPDAAYVNGATLTVDGALTATMGMTR